MQIKPYLSEDEKRGQEKGAFTPFEPTPYDYRSLDPTGGFLYDIGTGTAKGLLGNFALGGLAGVNPMDYAAAGAGGLLARQTERTAFSPFASKFSEYLNIDTPIGRIGRTLGSAISRIALGILDPTKGFISTPLSMFLGPLFGKAIESMAESMGYVGPEQRALIDYLAQRVGSPQLDAFSLYGKDDPYGLLSELDPLGELYGPQEPDLGMPPGFFDFEGPGEGDGDYDFGYGPGFGGYGIGGE